MSPHPHLFEFTEDLTRYKNVRLFCLIPGSLGMWQERMTHRLGTIEDVLVLVKIRDRLYRSTVIRF